MYTREQVSQLLNETITVIAEMDLMDNPMESPLNWEQSRKMTSALALLCEIEFELVREQRLSEDKNPRMVS